MDPFWELPAIFRRTGAPVRGAGAIGDASPAPVNAPFTDVKRAPGGG